MIALVCIAKNEDFYIDEWIKYHTKLGFDYIYVYQNNWRYKGDKSQFDNVHWIEFDGNAKQLEAYKNFLIHQSSNYDWVAFFDVDEYLVIDGFPPLSNWLKKYSNYYAVGVNWRIFGDSGITEVTNYSCINRFIKAENKLDQHIKSILNCKKCRESNIIDKIEFCDPHSFRKSLNSDFTVSTDISRFINGPFNRNYLAKDQLNHYYSKTLSEFVNVKLNRGFADQIGTYKTEGFYANNKNDIIDTRAKDFYNN